MGDVRTRQSWIAAAAERPIRPGAFSRAGLNDGLFSETMDFRDVPSVLSAVRVAQS